MNEKKIRRKWDRGRKRSSRISAIMKFRIRFWLIVTPLVLLWSGVSLLATYTQLEQYQLSHDVEVALGRVFMVDGVMFAVGIVAFLGMLGSLNYQRQEVESRFKHNRDLLRACPTKHEQVFAMLEGVQRKISTILGVEPISNLNVYLDTANFTAGPSVIEQDSETRLVIPSGFFALAARDKDAARSILAHELGHVLQKDSLSWLLALRFSRATFACLTGYYLFCIVIGGPLTVWALSPISWRLTLSDYSPIFQSIASWAILLAFQYSIKSYRRKSETLADCIAMLVAGKEATLRALSLVSSKRKRSIWTRLISPHPTFEQRTRMIRSFA